ncbi:MAG: GIY-YIG nuclease family protein [Acidobacteria bacterium]|nr:GIY-YIG nuclease family protein [Acidobacteriota bacterium]
MNISKADFLVLNLQGIDLFLETVDAMVLATGNPYDECIKHVLKQIREYSALQDAFHQRPAETALAAPLTLTLGQLLERRTCKMKAYLGVGRNVVYIVRDDGRVLYVGSTRRDARRRMKSHQKTHSPLGQALRNDPNAVYWSVEMVPYSDYREAAQKERALIAELTPAFCRR